jgi:hypothetical protein
MAGAVRVNPQNVKEEVKTLCADWTNKRILSCMWLLFVDRWNKATIRNKHYTPAWVALVHQEQQSSSHKDVKIMYRE